MHDYLEYSESHSKFILSKNIQFDISSSVSQKSVYVIFQDLYFQSNSHIQKAYDIALYIALLKSSFKLYYVTLLLI